MNVNKVATLATSENTTYAKLKIHLAKWQSTFKESSMNIDCNIKRIFLFSLGSYRKN